MPVYLYTLHAYRSWMPDHARGYVERRKGILAPNRDKAWNYRQLARYERMTFNGHLCRVLIEAAKQSVDRQKWRIHAATAVWSHVHVLLSWQEYRDAYRVRSVLKRTLTVSLRDATNQQRPWFSRAGSVKRVRDRAHFDRLMTSYLPGHKRYGGAWWFEGEDPAAKTPQL
ncbi:MAG: hypothetical protein IT440_13030 [Phycisphaeraceae bacterium]|nr:hypothetical protein [Phycisphaeraceae bacterium]